MDYRIQRAKKRDMEEISELWNKLSYDQMSKDPYLEQNLEFRGYPNLKNAMSSKFGTFFVARYQKKVIGFIEIVLRHKDYYFFLDNYAYILHMYVEEEYRKDLTVSLDLIKAAEDWAVSMGCRYLEADVFNHNKEIAKLLEFKKLRPYRTRYVKKLRKKGPLKNGDT